MKRTGKQLLILIFWAASVIPSLHGQELTPAESAYQVPSPADSARRRQYLREILKINIDKDHRHAISRRVTLQDSTWLDWLHRTGELPPDFSRMPSEPFLPDPLVLENNGESTPVRSALQWGRKRKAIKAAFEYWVSGHAPPPPDDFRAKILSEREETGTRIQMIEVNFGPEYKARMTFELMIPAGEGPFPVYMTQWNHRNWAQLAVRRGYIGCVYAGADSKDDTQAYQQLYPAYDFTCLMRRAWGASRVVDYLLTRKEVNKDQIAITGHSRNGKQALWAAAFDERIAAVISSSSGTGGITPWRYSDPQYCNQTLDDICSNAAHWFHPRLRFFFGREDKLPVDQNLLLSLIAPRILLLHYSVVEKQLNPWVNEQCYLSVKKVYDFLGAGKKIGLLPRMGEHAVAARDLERCLDFLDVSFGRKVLPWENQLYYNYSFASWAEAHRSDSLLSEKVEPVVLQDQYHDTSDYLTDRKTILRNLQWLLGNEPAGVKPVDIAPAGASRVDWIDRITGRPAVSRVKVVNIGPYTAMGDHMAGTLYVPVDGEGNRRAERGGKIPVVIYLHQYAHAHGFALGYSRDGGNGNSQLFQELTDQGFAVMAIDMFGFGTRMKEAQFFYTRFPAWSRMGKMVSDVSACIDALETMDFIDKKRIFLLGNTIGGSVSLIAAARDERIAGVAAVAAFSPWRTSNGQYESLRAYSHVHGFLPKLGWYADKPQEVPVDFGGIMSCIAPRPLFVISPVFDRHSDPKAVKEVVSRLANVYALYGKQEHLVFQTPDEINRITPHMLQDVISFYKRASLNE